MKDNESIQLGTLIFVSGFMISIAILQQLRIKDLENSLDQHKAGVRYRERIILLAARLMNRDQQVELIRKLDEDAKFFQITRNF